MRISNTLLLLILAIPNLYAVSSKCNTEEQVQPEERYKDNTISYMTVKQKDNSILLRSYITQPILNSNKDQFSRVVFIFHGGAGNGCSMRNGIDIKSMSNSNKINNKSTLYIYPNAIADSVAFGGINSNGVPYYNNSEVAHWSDGRDPSNYIDDIKFIKQIISKIEEQYNIKEYYAAGFSNGSIFSHYLASQENKIKAIFAANGHVPKELNYSLSLNSHIIMVSAVGDNYMKIEGTDIFRSALESLDVYRNAFGYKSNEMFLYNETSDKYPYKNDIYSDLVTHRYYLTDGDLDGSKKIVWYSEVTDTNPNKALLPGHCWHRNTDYVNGEYCTTNMDYTRIMLNSFTEIDKISN